MLQLPQEFNGIRKTIFEDIEFLAPRLRYEDKREILDATGLNPFFALSECFNCSEISLTMHPALLIKTEPRKNKIK